MPTCGHCHSTGQTVDHIRSCFEQERTTNVSHFAKQYVENFRPMALTGGVDGQ